MSIKLTEAEEEFIEKKAKEHSEKENSIMLPLSIEYDVEMFIEALEESLEEIKSNNGYESYVDFVEESAPYEDYTYTQVYVKYYTKEVTEKYIEEERERTLRRKQERYDTYLELKGEFEGNDL